MAQKEILSYRNWLLKNHIDQDTRIGDLAREAPVLALMESYVQYRDYVEDVLNGLRI